MRCSWAWASVIHQQSRHRRRREWHRGCSRVHARLRQASDKSQLPVGRNVVVIGGGMTAIDAAVQAKLIGCRAGDHRLSPQPDGNGRFVL